MKNNFLKNSTKENECHYKKQRNICITLRRKSIKKYFTNISKQSIVTNANFWKVLKPSLTKQDHINSGDIILSNGRNIITDEEELVKVFHNHYINIVKSTCCEETMHIARDTNIDNITLAIEVITYN